VSAATRTCGAAAITGAEPEPYGAAGVLGVFGVAAEGEKRFNARGRAIDHAMGVVAEEEQHSTRVHGGSPCGRALCAFVPSV
jgi:hypothetical protein